MATSDDNNSFYDFTNPDFTRFTSDCPPTTEPEETEESQQLEDVKNIQQKHEFICLKYNRTAHVLEEGQSFESLMESYNHSSSTLATNEDEPPTKSISNDKVFVVSFLGDTSTGKSFLANHLLGAQTYFVNKDQHGSPTTANVTLFESTTALASQENNKCFVLDFEGENGTRMPRLLRYALDYISPSQLAKGRRDAVAKYFPPLAYLLSDVIILMGQDDLFANSRYIERVEKFVSQAVADVQQNIRRPILILVQNQYPGNKVMSPEEATQKFLNQNSGAQSILNFFSGIRCCILPFMKKETTTNIDQNFNEQMEKLKKLLIASRTHQQKNLLPELPWLLLARQVIQKLVLNETIVLDLMLHDLFMEKQGEEGDEMITFLFRSLYGKETIHSIRWFNHCHDFALEVLARSIAMRCTHYEFEGIAELISNECHKRLTELWPKIDQYRPCEALYMGKGYVKQQDRPVFCYQHKGHHGNKHKTSEKVRQANWLKALFTWSTVDTWDGSFYNKNGSSDKPERSIYDKLVQTTNDFLKEFKINNKGKYTTFNQLLQKWRIDVEFKLLIGRKVCACCLEPMVADGKIYIFQKSLVCAVCREELKLCQVNPPSRSGVSSPTSMDEENECKICMAAPRRVLFTPCNHFHYCETCAKEIFEKYQKCAICKQSVKSIVEPKQQ